MALNEWNIQSRAHQCAETLRPFLAGEKVYSALYYCRQAYQRIDRSKEGWDLRERSELIKDDPGFVPLSVWQSDYVPPAPPSPEALRQDDAESLLRRLMPENDPGSLKARYILALMLERKKTLRQIKRQKSEDGKSVLVYEHEASGEVWLIEDPEIRMADISSVQDEVAQLLARQTDAHPSQ